MRRVHDGVGHERMTTSEGHADHGGDDDDPEVPGIQPALDQDEHRQEDQVQDAAARAAAKDGQQQNQDEQRARRAEEQRPVVLEGEPDDRRFPSGT